MMVGMCFAGIDLDDARELVFGLRMNRNVYSVWLLDMLDHYCSIQIRRNPFKLLKYS